MKEDVWDSRRQGTRVGSPTSDAADVVSERETVLRIVKDLYSEVALGFETILINGVPEAKLFRLYSILLEKGLHTAAERALLLANYCHSVRVRVESLNSRRGLRRARDDVLRGLQDIMTELDNLNNLISL